MFKRNLIIKHIENDILSMSCHYAVVTQTHTHKDKTINPTLLF